MIRGRPMVSAAEMASGPISNRQIEAVVPPDHAVLGGRDDDGDGDGHPHRASSASRHRAVSVRRQVVQPSSKVRRPAGW